MVYPPNASDIEHQITIQVQLAGLTTVDDIRSMHEDLEQLYRTQLVALALAEALPRLGASQYRYRPQPSRSSLIAATEPGHDTLVVWKLDRRVSASRSDEYRDQNAAT